jgi:hypothetical protein
LIWKYENEQKEYFVGYICIFNHLWNGSTINSIYVQIVCKGSNIFCAVKKVLDVHVVKLCASGCSVILYWIDRNQHLCTNCVNRMNHFLCCSRHFLDMHVNVKLYTQEYSVIFHWICPLQALYYVAEIAWYLSMQKYVLDLKHCKEWGCTRWVKSPALRHRISKFSKSPKNFVLFWKSSSRWSQLCHIRLQYLN